MPTKATDLHALAQTLLSDHKSIAAAADALATRLAKEAGLRRDIAFDFLSRHREAAKSKPGPRSRTRAGPHRHRQLGTPTAEQKIGALQAERVLIDTIFDRKLRGGKKLGDIRVHELRATAESSASTATSFLQRGYEDAVETFACVLLSKHCVASDPFAKVRDVIKPKVASEIFVQAQADAAKALADSSGRLAQELIAAAQQAELQP